MFQITPTYAQVIFSQICEVMKVKTSFLSATEFYRNKNKYK